MDWIPPMSPILVSEIKSENEWIHQIKWDGIRGMTYISKKEVRIFTKRGNERTDFYPELHSLTDIIDGYEAILDGEIIVLGENEKPTFQKVMVRERVSNKKRLPHYMRNYPVNYIVFDILYYNGKTLTNLPLNERKEILKKVLTKNKNITITDDFEDGMKLYNLMKEKNWEGIVSKKLDSKYSPGKNHKDWFKVKITKKLLSVVCGLNLKNGFPKSLILGIYNNNSLIYIGNASIGLTQKDFKLLKEYSSHLETDKSPFDHNLKIEDALWFRPALTCWVSFMEWTFDDQLRHPKILGFASLKPDEANGKEIIE